MLAVRRALGVLQLVVGVGAVGGGAGLVADPSGGLLGLSARWLERSPFTSYLVPGLALLLVNGLTSTGAGIATLKGWRHAGLGGLGLGLFLVAFIGVQVAAIGLSSWMQPLFFGVGVLEASLGVVLWRTSQS